MGAFLPYDAGVSKPFINNNSAPESNVNGLRRFNTASRVRQKVHGYTDYQVTDGLTVGVGGDFVYDDYAHSNYGLQSSRNWGINFDSSYAFDKDTSVQVFYSYQDMLSKTAGNTSATNAIATTATPPALPVPYSSTPGSVVGGCYDNVLARNSNGKVDPCNNWNTRMSDNVDTVGLSLKHKGLLSGKLDVNGDFVYSFARTLIGVSGGQYVTGPAPATSTVGPLYYIPTANMPEVKTQTFQFKLDAKYAINKPSAVRLSYMYQHMFSSDYVYTGTQPAGTPTGLMPTFEQAPKYSNHVIGLSYIYNF